MKTNDPNTMAGILDIPQFRAWNLESLRLKDLHAASMAMVNSHNGMPYADSEALEFYTLNHLAALIARHRTPNERISGTEIEVLKKWREVMVSQARRALYYIALITTREIRHNYEHSSPTDEEREKFIAEIGSTCMKMIDSIRGKSQQVAINVMSKNSTITALKWFEAVEYMFANGAFSGGFGGKPWANITNCLTRTLRGEFSMEMMVDTSYTLAHNNGPMHNKSMLYSGYSQELIVCLDVQRAGLMPEMVLEARICRQFLQSWLRDFVMRIKSMYPGEIGEYVDWQVVKDRGAVSNVGQLIQNMYKLHPESKVKKPTVVNGKQDTGNVYDVDHQHTLAILKRVA